VTWYQLQVGHNPSALDFLADVANSAGNHVAGETSRGTAAAAVSAGMQPINGILKVHQNRYSWYYMLAGRHSYVSNTGCFTLQRQHSWVASQSMATCAAVCSW